MRAETQSLVEEIKQSLKLSRSKAKGRGVQP